MFYRRTVYVRKHEIWITKNNNNQCQKLKHKTKTWITNTVE